MNDAAPAGHNNPPLPEVLAEETAALVSRRDALLAALSNSRVEDAKTAEALTTLAGLIKALRDVAETARKARAQPFDDGKAAVQRAFKADIIDALDAGLVTARGMMDAWRRKQEEAAAAERRAREAAAAKAQVEAEAAEAAQREAEAAGDMGAAIQAEMRGLQAQEQAARLSGDDGVIRPTEPIRAMGGAALTTTRQQVEIIDLSKTLAWLQRNQREALIEAVSPLVSRAVRAKIAVPGVRVAAVAGTRFGR